MPRAYKDRVSDTSTTTGTGTLTLTGVAPTGYRTFAAALTTGDTVRYCVANIAGTEWEVGQGVWTSSGATLTRATVYASSNANALVNFSAGTLTVSVVATAADFVRPVFRAYRASNQTITVNQYNKVQITTVAIDTCGGFDNTTDYRYTPNVAGHYMFTGQVAGSGYSRLFANIYKNGSVVAGGSDNATAYRSSVNDIIYMNGTTDYVELWVYSTVSPIVTGTASDIYFAGALVVPDV